MSKHLNKECLYKLPSGNTVHPSRLIIRDGTLMWKHAFLHNNRFTKLPSDPAHEQHIIKTAQRLEELNTWVSQGLEPWQCLMPFAWYDPDENDLDQGISVWFKHTEFGADEVYEKLKNNVQLHETLHIYRATPLSACLFFRRC